MRLAQAIGGHFERPNSPDSTITTSMAARGKPTAFTALNRLLDSDADSDADSADERQQQQREKQKQKKKSRSKKKSRCASGILVVSWLSRVAS